MKKMYLTKTLLDAWRYYIDSQDSFEESAKESFFNVLNKIKTEPTPDMIRGLSFEKEIYDYLEGIEPLESREDKLEIAETLKGSLIQEPLLTKFMIFDNNIEIYLYGITDAIKFNTIYDIKSVRSYTPPKYNKSTQHLIYLASSDCTVFTYLISDGEYCYKETYHKSDRIYQELRNIILDFLNWLKTTNNFETYLKNYDATEKLEAYCE